MSVAPLPLGVANTKDTGGYAKALAAAQMAAWSWHMDSSKVNFSGEFYSLTGLKPDSITTLHQFLDLLTAESQQQFVMQVGRASSRCEQIDCQLQLLLENGVCTCHLLGAVERNTNRLGQASGVIRIQPTRLGAPADPHKVLPDLLAREVVDHTGTAIVIKDIAGHYLMANRQFRRLFCPDGRSVVGRSDSEFFDRQTARRIRKLDETVVETGQALQLEESFQIGHESRTYLSVRFPLLDANGNLYALGQMLTDVTQQKVEAVARETELRETQARYQAFIASSTDAIWCYELASPVDVSASVTEQVRAIDKDARLAECNDYFAKRYQVADAATLLGSKLKHSAIPRYREQLQRFVENNYRLIDCEVERRAKNGETEFWQITTIGTVRDGKLLRLWGTSKDITERHRHVEQLRYQATHDSLTHLPNRTRLYREIESTVKSRRNDQHMALLIIDLDRFKEINDTLGHQAGDKLLRQLGPRLEAELDQLPGLIARLGGDEFAVFLPDIVDVQQAVTFGQRVLEVLHEPFVIEGFHTELGASIGISSCPEQADDVGTLMRYADVAMYRAKQDMLGVALYHADQDPHSPKRLALMGELGRAIRENQLVLQFQPKIALHTNAVAGYEALVCWNHPQLGFIAPSEFVPMAECSGVIHPLTYWVLEHSLQQARDWAAQGFNFPVSVNLSSRNLLDSRIAGVISDLLSQYGVAASQLELEITESAIMDDPARALDVLRQIHALGVRLAIDDFGTGYSSLAYLKKLPVQTLKIDYTFVVNMLDDEQDRIIVNSTIHLAHNLGLTVVAEGVETAAALAALADMGCDYAQGYHILKPADARTLADWLRRGAGFYIP